jgi:hypothetical protein
MAAAGEIRKKGWAPPESNARRPFLRRLANWQSLRGISVKLAEWLRNEAGTNSPIEENLLRALE